MAPASQAARTAEQDHAAGGRVYRTVWLDDGRRATASIHLEAIKRSRRVYAYLRYKAGGRNYRIYVGDASAETRAEALRRAWGLVQEQGLLGRPPDSSKDERLAGERRQARS
jgi:DNA mismatch endonuclease (patch repair protein)